MEGSRYEIHTIHGVEHYSDTKPYIQDGFVVIPSAYGGGEATGLIPVENVTFILDTFPRCTCCDGEPLPTANVESCFTQSS